MTSLITNSTQSSTIQYKLPQSDEYNEVLYLYHLALYSYLLRFRSSLPPLSSSMSSLLHISQVKLISSRFSMSFVSRPEHSKWYQLDPLHFSSLLHWIHFDPGIFLLQIHFYSSSLSVLPRFCVTSFRLVCFPSLGLYELFLCNLISSSRSFSTFLSRLKELKNALSVKDLIFSGLIARIEKVLSRH